MGNLAGKVAIVTGSSRGIGRAIAERFAAEGAAVTVNYNRSADEARAVVSGIEHRGGKAIAIQGDASAVADIRRLFRETIAKFGGVDIVVNNAGPTPDESGAGAPKPIAEISEREFDAYINGFARGPFFVMQEAARNLQDGGRVINISSVISDLRPPFAAPYAGAKSALEAFSELPGAGTRTARNYGQRDCAGRCRNQDAAGFAGRSAGVADAAHTVGHW